MSEQFRLSGRSEDRIWLRTERRTSKKCYMSVRRSTGARNQGCMAASVDLAAGRLNQVPLPSHRLPAPLSKKQLGRMDTSEAWKYERDWRQMRHKSLAEIPTSTRRQDFFCIDIYNRCPAFFKRAHP